MTDIASAWMAAGTVTVMLPSGMQIKWEPTSPAELMVRGVFPGYLRAMAEQFSGEGIDPSKLDDKGKDDWKAMVALLVRHTVREVCAPGGTFVPYMLSDEQVNDDDPRMPRVDLEALQHLALHLRSPREVDATSRIAALQRQMSAAIERGASDEEIDLLRTEIETKASEYRRIIVKEAAESMFGWATFRDIGQRVADRDLRAERSESVEPADHLGPGGRPRRRSSRRRASAGGSDATAAAK